MNKISLIIEHKLVRKILYLFFLIVYKFNLVNVFYYFFFIYISLNVKLKILSDKEYRGKPVVVTFWRESFLKDQKNLYSSKKINLIIIKPYIWATYTKIFYPKEIRGQILFHLSNDVESLRTKQKAIDFVSPVLNKLHKKNLIDAFIFGNVDYMEHQSWAHAALSLKIPAVVMLCEGYFTKYWYSKFINQDHFSLKTKFPFTKVFVPGSSASDLAVDANICSYEDIIVTGYPRTDSTYKIVSDSLVKNFSEKKIILLIAFNEPNYLCDNMWNDVLLEFTDLAKNNPNESFLIKTKRESLTQNIVGALKVNNIENLIIRDDLTMEEISKNLKLVISFTSTFLLEMMCSDLPLVVPLWEDGFKSYESGATFFDLKNSGIQYVKSKDEFASIINAIILNKNNESDNKRELRDIYLAPYLHKIDGMRTDAVADEIIKLM